MGERRRLSSRLVEYVVLYNTQTHLSVILRNFRPEAVLQATTSEGEVNTLKAELTTP